MVPGEAMTGLKMPEKYVYEMLCDRIAACKIYNGRDYEPENVLRYYESSKDHYLLHKDTKRLLEKLLHMLVEHGEDYTFAYIRKKRKKGLRG